MLGEHRELNPHADRIRLKNPAPMVPPVPAIILSVRGLENEPDELTVVWTFVVNGKPPQIGISVLHEHIARDRIEKHGEFVLNVPVAGITYAFDKVDMNSTKVTDKYALSGLTRGKAVSVNAPTVEECPIQVECKVITQTELAPSRTIFLASVEATTVLEGVVDDSEMLLVEDVPLLRHDSGQR